MLDHFCFELLYIGNIFNFDFSFVSILVYIYFNPKPLTVYQSLLGYLHLLIHSNCMYELVAHVRAMPLHHNLNSHPVNIINAFLCFIYSLIFIVRLFGEINK